MEAWWTLSNWYCSIIQHICIKKSRRRRAERIQTSTTHNYENFFLSYMFVGKSICYLRPAHLSYHSNIMYLTWFYYLLKRYKCVWRVLFAFGWRWLCIVVLKVSAPWAEHRETWTILGRRHFKCFLHLKLHFRWANHRSTSISSLYRYMLKALGSS